jgi:hypothetical protein
MSTRRLVPEDEEISMDTMVEKFHQGAIWHGLTELNIGWPDELQRGLSQADRIHLLVGRKTR